MLPDRGNVVSSIHWVSPSASNASRNLESDEEATLGWSSNDQLIDGKLKSPIRMISLSMHVSSRYEIRRASCSLEFEGGLYTAYTCTSSELSWNDITLGGDASTSAIVSLSDTYAQTPCVLVFPLSLRRSKYPGIPTTTSSSAGVKWVSDINSISVHPCSLSICWRIGSFVFRPLTLQCAKFITCVYSVWLCHFSFPGSLVGEQVGLDHLEYLGLHKYHWQQTDLMTHQGHKKTGLLCLSRFQGAWEQFPQLVLE